MERSFRLVKAAAWVVVASLSVVPGAWAQADTLDLSVEDFANEALPDGGPASANVTVAYPCGTQLQDITVSAVIKDGAGGAVQVDPATFTVQTPPGCTPNANVEHSAAVLFSAGLDQLAGTQVGIDVTASVADATGQGISDSVTKALTAVVGPYVEVTFSINVSAFEVLAGETVPVSVQVASESNTEIMAMPELEGVPPTWSRPNVLPVQVPSPLSGGSGMGELSFEVEVPEDAEGTVMLSLTLFAHSLGGTYVQTEETTIPIEFIVTPSDAMEDKKDDSKDSPAGGALPVLVLLLAFVAAARRRT